MQPPVLVDPDQPLTGGFVLRLPFAMARRIEDGSLVFWHSPKGLTFWIDAYEAEGGDPLPGWRSRRSAEGHSVLAVPARTADGRVRMRDCLDKGGGAAASLGLARATISSWKGGL